MKGAGGRRIRSRRPLPPHRPVSATPFSHHDVIALAEPFERRGWRVDLAASARDRRRLVFRPAAAEERDATTLQLDDLGGGRYRLLRTVQHAGGAVATLRADGSAPEALLARVSSVPAGRHFVEAAGAVVARDYVHEGELALARGSVQLPGLLFAFTVPQARGLAAEVVLRPTPEGAPRPALPEDLLAVLGWSWARLVPDRRGWTTRVRLRARGAARTARAEALLDRAAAHLARTLAEPPARFHERWRAARWGVFCRRGIPTFTALGLVGAVLLSARFDLQLSTTAMVLLYHLPTAVIAASFMLQELPRFEFPPWPRPFGPGDWSAPGPSRVRSGDAPSPPPAAPAPPATASPAPAPRGPA